MEYLEKRTGIVVCFLLAVSSANLHACQVCDKVLQLTVKQWTCLEKKIPGMLKKDLSLVFFQLPIECTQNQTLISHKSADPQTRKPKTISEIATKTFAITKSQLDCINNKITEIVNMNHNYEFVFEDKCSKLKSN